jgi:hypothetical protein
MGRGLVWFDKTVQACQGPTSFIVYARGLVIFEYSHVFRSGGSLMCILTFIRNPSKTRVVQFNAKLFYNVILDVKQAFRCKDD